MTLLWREVATIAQKAVKARVTPGLSCSVHFRNQLGKMEHSSFVFGAQHYGEHAREISSATQYDLASVTKAIVGTAIVRASHTNHFSLNQSIGELLPETRSYPVGSVSLFSLLSHRADLPAWRNYYHYTTPKRCHLADERTKIMKAVLSTSRTGDQHAYTYSDVGYIIAAEVASRVVGKDLATLVKEQVTLPLGIESALGFRGVGEEFRSLDIPPTEYCSWRKQVIQGEVHDENAYALGGIAGHAGLFGTSYAVSLFGWRLLESLHGDDQWMTSSLLQLMNEPQAGGSHRLVFDGKSPGVSTAGRWMSDRTFGHLGFTGTSFWCDPSCDVSIALLTNRVHPTRYSEGIRALRIDVHEAVMAALGHSVN